MKLISTILLATAAVLYAGATTNPAEGLKTRLQAAMTEGKVYFGHHDDPVYGHDWRGDTARSDVLESCGKYPGLMSWDLGDIEWGKDTNLDGVPFDRIRKEVIAQNTRGGINTFSWHADHPVTGADSWKTADTTAVSALLHTTEGRAAYAMQLDRLCDFFNSLIDENGHKIAVIFRPWHEHTGSWFWWGRDNCSIADYKALWRMMRRHFDSRGVDNVLWAYSPDRCPDAETYMERYPGDEYVDIMGADVYHFNNGDGTEEYRRCAGITLGIASAEAKKRDKIAAFTETGHESLTINDWFTSVLLPILEAQPIAYVTVWRNAYRSPRHFFAPYAGHPSAPDFKEFSESPTTFFIP